MVGVSGVKTLYIEPGSPWENAYSETFIRRFGDELLKREVFADFWKRRSWWRITATTTTTKAAQRVGYRTPAEFVAAADLVARGGAGTEELESVPTLS